MKLKPFGESTKEAKWPGASLHELVGKLGDLVTEESTRVDLLKDTSALTVRLNLVEEARVLLEVIDNGDVEIMREELARLKTRRSSTKLRQCCAMEAAELSARGLAVYFTRERSHVRWDTVKEGRTGSFRLTRADPNGGADVVTYIEPEVPLIAVLKSDELPNG